MISQTNTGSTDATAEAFDALTKLIVRGDLPAIEAAIKERPALLTAEDKEGWSPLIWAAAMGMSGVLDCLIGKGAPLNHADINGMTALMAAAEYDDEKLVMPLLKAGTAKLLKDGEGRTAADYARRAGGTALAETIEKFRAENPVALKADTPVRRPIKVKKVTP
jgi:ankyrin repeat protein